MVSDEQKSSQGSMRQSDHHAKKSAEPVDVDPDSGRLINAEDGYQKFKAKGFNNVLGDAGIKMLQSIVAKSYKIKVCFAYTYCEKFLII